MSASHWIFCVVPLFYIITERCSTHSELGRPRFNLSSLSKKASISHRLPDCLLWDKDEYISFELLFFFFFHFYTLSNCRIKYSLFKILLKNRYIKQPCSSDFPFDKLLCCYYFSLKNLNLKNSIVKDGYFKILEFNRKYSIQCCSYFIIFQLVVKVIYVPNDYSSYPV